MSFKPIKSSFVLLFCLSAAVWANQTPQNTQIQTTLSQSQTLQKSAEQQSNQSRLTENRWSEWGLTEQDWTRYEELKKGPQGVWSPNLDPLTMLGIEARSESERNRYAELLARKEFERNEKILTFQLAYDAAFKRLYPNILPFQVDEQGSPNVVPASSSRIIYFTRSDCSEKCITDMKKLFAHAGSNPVDIYLVDSEQSDEKIRKWAMDNNIDVEKVRSRQITLNHDRGLWLKNTNGKIPVAYRIIGGAEWQRIGY